MAESASELQFEIEKLERKHAEHPEGRFFVPLANAYRKMGDVETAEALLRAGVERHPDYLSAHIVLGRCLADRGATADAEAEFRFVLSQDPQNLIALRTLGELAAADNRSSEAADWYRELLAVDPMNEDARQALDALSDAPPTGELEAEFRSGAGWWEPEPEPAAAEDLQSLEADAAAEAVPVEEEPALLEPIDRWSGDDDLPDLSAEREPEEAKSSLPEMPGGAPTSPAEVSAEYEAPEEGSSQVVTETIAELYARQGLHERAASVYRELIRRRGGDAALEKRLAELEGQIDAERDQPLDHGTAGEPLYDEAALEELDLAIEDEAAAAGADAADPFASSFVDGFGADALAADSDERAPETAAAPPSRQTIAHFLADMAGWRPSARAVPVLPAAEEGESAVAEDQGWEAGAVADLQEEPTPELQNEAVADLQDEALSDLEEPWVADLDEDSAPLPFLEGTIDDSGTHGTGSAEEEPFPWEVPGPGPEAEREIESPDAPPPLDSFPAEEAVAGAAPFPADERQADVPPPAEQPPVPETGAAAESVSEDEDLESFQAWLRSLKR